MRTAFLSALIAACAMLSPTPLVAQSSADGQPAATNELMLFLRDSQSAAAVARDYKLTLLGPLVDAPTIVRFSAANVAAAQAAQPLLSADSRVQQAIVQNLAQHQVFSFAPNDPFYFPGSNPGVGGISSSTSSTTFPGQWHLTNQMPNSALNDNTVDVRITGAWNRDLTGAGVVIGIVDYSVTMSHPDLAPNNRADLSRFFDTVGGSSASPDPPASDTNVNHRHGTSVAGVAAARGNNGLGGTGAAPLASLAGIRTDLNTTALANSYTWHNDEIQIKSHSYGIPAGFVVDSTLSSTLTATAGSVIHVFAAGNDRNTTTNPSGQDCNTKDNQNTSGVITVAALGSNGKYANYSCFGANVFVCAPSNSTNGTAYSGITTADRPGSIGYNSGSSGSNFATASGGGTGGDYTNNFGGTSSATPLVSGVIALAYQARNQVGYTTNVRVMQHLLARTSRIVDASDSSDSSDGGWRTNAAGFHFNQNYGFGCIDADALTLLAVHPDFAGVSPQVTHNIATKTLSAAIPDNNAVGVSDTFNVATTGHLEDVLVTLSITHTSRGQLEAYLTSPSGYRSRLVNNSSDTNDDINWQFNTNAFWGENITGLWTLTVADLSAGTTGTWGNYSVILHTGDPVPEPAFVGVGILAIGLIFRRKVHA